MSSFSFIVMVVEAHPDIVVLYKMHNCKSVECVTALGASWLQPLLQNTCQCTWHLQQCSSPATPLPSLISRREIAIASSGGVLEKSIIPEVARHPVRSTEGDHHLPLSGGHAILLTRSLPRPGIYLFFFCLLHKHHLSTTSQSENMKFATVALATVLAASLCVSSNATMRANSELVQVRPC